MPEETVWRGTSSQWKNFGLYILCALFCWLIVPIFIALARYLQTKNKVYELTTERLKITERGFSKVTDTLELYRVKDLETRQPFLYRTFRVENVQLNTSDASSPFIFIQAIRVRSRLGTKFGTRWKRFGCKNEYAKSTLSNRFASQRRDRATSE
jgi:membrane protein YdbS with pleckstrin-like domain